MIYLYIAGYALIGFIFGHWYALKSIKEIDIPESKNITTEQIMGFAWIYTILFALLWPVFFAEFIFVTIKRRLKL